MFPALILSLALSWVQVRSDVFVVKSSAGIEKARRVLRELESFRELIGTTIFRNVVLPDLPIEVLVVGDAAQYTELSPVYNGKKVQIAGFYERGQDRDFIVLKGNLVGNLTHVVYHELTHSFLSRSLQQKPPWLGEGLAEYFSTAEVSADAIYLGGLSPERMDALRTDHLLPLSELLAVDEDSPQYNEADKANVFYSESWAFVHFLMHGTHSRQFKVYLDALTRGDADLTTYLKTDLSTLDIEFQVYLKSRIRMSGRERIKPHPAAWRMRTEPVTAADIELAITEIFLSSGRLDDARRHLERVTETDVQFARASYYRGVLAVITKDSDPKEHFIDALMDPVFGPRAAIHLVQLHALDIPGARRALEQAAASGTRMGDVYWALSEIYLADSRKAWELLQIAHSIPTPPKTRGVVIVSPNPDVPMFSYGHGDGDHFRYELLSPTGKGPDLQKTTTPYFPDELRTQRASGKVILDVEVTELGDVAGIYMISALPEVFGDLAAAAVQDWKFAPGPAKIRVVVQFIP